MATPAAIALHRFGLGAAPGELATVARDPKAWLWRQTGTATPTPDPKPLQTAMRRFQAAARTADISARRARLRALFADIRKMATPRYGREFVGQAASPTPFIERLIWFWTNHFTVSVKGKSRVLPFVSSYVDDAIRPHVLGRFADMLVAVERHPAMQVYLDNTLSVGPNSPAGKRNRRDLNENLAREILELHTIGVNGGYGQEDVIALAKLLTGWTVPMGPNAPANAPPFIFARRRHEPGPKRIMGVVYGDGLAEGERALRDLAVRRETARFIATKLCRHFLADEPDDWAIGHVAARFEETGGDLRSVAQALIEAMDLPAVAKARKFRAPAEYMAALVRAFGPDLAAPETVFKTLADWGQAPFLANSPAGYSDLTSDLAQPDAILRRLEWASATATARQIDVHPLEIARDVFDDALRAQTATALADAESPTDALALLLVSPEFMWR